MTMMMKILENLKCWLLVAVLLAVALPMAAQDSMFPKAETDDQIDKELAKVKLKDNLKVEADSVLLVAEEDPEVANQMLLALRKRYQGECDQLINIACYFYSQKSIPMANIFANTAYRNRAALDQMEKAPGKICEDHVHLSLLMARLAELKKKYVEASIHLDEVLVYNSEHEAALKKQVEIWKNDAPRRAYEYVLKLREASPNNSAVKAAAEQLRAIFSGDKPNYKGVYLYVPNPPSFPEGKKGLRTFLKENRQNPEVVLSGEVQGYVRVKCLVDENGKVSNAVVEESLHPDCDREALRLVQAFPTLIPGKKKDGLQVTSEMAVDIKFSNVEQSEEDVYKETLINFLKVGGAGDALNRAKLIDTFLQTAKMRGGKQEDELNALVEKYVDERFDKDMAELLQPLYQKIVTVEELDTLVQLYSRTDYQMLQLKSKAMEAGVQNLIGSPKMINFLEKCLDNASKNKPYKPLSPVKCSESYRQKFETLTSEAMTFVGTLVGGAILVKKKVNLTSTQLSTFSLAIVDYLSKGLLQEYKKTFTEQDLDVLIEVLQAPVQKRFSEKGKDMTGDFTLVGVKMLKNFIDWYDVETKNAAGSSSVESTQENSSTEKDKKEIGIPPVFPGGENALLDWVAQNIQYPKEALKKNIQGVVLLRFVVMEDGSIGDVLVTRGIDPDCDKEAVRVINSLPRFIPGRQDGKPVKVWYTLPIRFQIQD